MVQRSLTSIIQQIEQDFTDVRDEFLVNIAEDLIGSSKYFVDTGAYITSHSITTTRGAGRSRSSHNKPQGQSPEAKGAESLDQLMGDIAALPFDQEQVYISNNAPHASAVEYKHGHSVYESVRSRATNHLLEAVEKVRGSL